MSREFAPNFHRRYLEQIAFETSVLSGKEDSPGGITEGIYSGEDLFYQEYDQLVVEYFRDSRGNEHEMKNGEVLLAHQIAEQLKSKPSDRPIMALDIGGGAGKTWTKLGLKFENDVRAGNLALVVSNIKGTPYDYAPRHTPTGRFITENSGLVHYVTGTFSDIGNKKIELPNGVTRPIQGTADVVHEEISLTAWSLIPDWDILEVPPLLSSRGIYIVHRGDISYEGRSLPDGPLDWSEDHVLRFDRDRVIGTEIAHDRLQREFGLRKTTQVEKGSLRGKEMGYMIFKGQQAPLVSLSGNIMQRR